MRRPRRPGAPWPPVPGRLPPMLMAAQGLASAIDALRHVECRRIFSEMIGARIKTRLELQDAIQLVRDIKGATADRTVVLTVRERKRLARIAAELMTGTCGTTRP